MAIPTDIAGLYAWYKASTFALLEGATCGVWFDSSGNGRNLTPAVTPIYRANQIGGFPAVEYVAGDNDTHGNATFGWLTSLANCTIFAVFAPGAIGGGNGSVFSSTGGSNAEGIGWNGTNVRMRNGASDALGGVLAENAWCYMYGCQTNGVHVGCALNAGAEVTTAAAGRGATTEYGSIALDGGAFTTCKVAEIFVYSSDLSAGNKTLMKEYLRDKYFGVAPGQQEQMRDVGSRRLWPRRVPSGIFEVNVPLWMLDADILDRVAIESQVGPAPGAVGWGAKKWQRRAFTNQRIAVDPASGTLKLLLLDRRPLDILLWDTARTDERNASARQSGVARLSKVVEFTFARLSLAWIENPADPTSIAQYGERERAINQTGEYLEEARTNSLLRSSSVSGTTGLTLAGTAVNGSAIVADTTDLFFDAGTTPSSLKFVAGSPHAAELRVTYPATASFLANTIVRVSVDHKTDTGEALYWRLQRSVDSWYWNDAGNTWGAGSVDNPMASHSDRDPADRYHSKKIDVGAGATTLTLSVFLQTGGTASRISHLYHSQIEAGTHATSRIVTDGSAVTRVKTELSHSITSAAKRYDPALGAFWCQVTPDWSSADLGSSEDRYLYWMETNGGADHDALYYDASAAAWVFERKVGGSTYTASKTASVTRGTTYSIGARWTGVEAELDLTAYTISVFVDGVKGTDATSAAPTFTSPETLYRGSDASFANQANGAMREVRILPYAPTDEEMARMP